MNDIPSSQQLEMTRFRVERLRIVANLVTVAITVGIGTFGVAYINRDYQFRQLEQQEKQNKAALKLQENEAAAARRQAEMKYLGEYVQYALETDIQKRLRFANYFAALTISEDLQRRWVSYRDQLKNLESKVKELESKRVVAARAGEKEKTAEIDMQLSIIRPELSGLNTRAPEDYQTAFSNIRTSELKLATHGEKAFKAGQYEWAVKFFEQARRVKASGVWQSSYPFLIGSYLILDREKLAKVNSDEMLKAIAAPHGYLRHDTTLGFLLNNLGDVRTRVPPRYIGFMDKLIDKVLAEKAKKT